MPGDIGVIIPAAGAGRRLGGISKPLIEIGGEAIIGRLVRLFSEVSMVKRICVAVQKQDIRLFQRFLQSADTRSLVSIIEGGLERPFSVRNAFQHIRESLDDRDLVCIHDAARPLLSREDLDRVLLAASEEGAAFLAVRVKDTLKVVDEDNFCLGTVDRSKMFAAQTPQVVRVELLSRAYSQVDDLSGVTDETMLLEKIGVKAFVIEPRHINPKITTAEDLELLRRLTS